MTFRFIDSIRSETHPVAVACEVLGVSRSSYYAWRDRPESQRAVRLREVAGKLKQLHVGRREAYGSPRMTAELAGVGIKVCVNTVAKLMKQQGLASRRCRRFRASTTDARHAYAVAENVLDQDFMAETPDAKWVADITYVPTGQGWLYVAAVMDLYSRKIVGWAMAEHLRTELCLEALEMAVRSREPCEQLVHHSDRGCQYACGIYRKKLEERGIRCSMSRTGNCYDNAAMESFWSTLKTELTHHQRYATREQAAGSIFEYIACWYNRKRRHSALGNVSPETFETVSD